MNLRVWLTAPALAVLFAACGSAPPPTTAPTAVVQSDTPTAEIQTDDNNTALDAQTQPQQTQPPQQQDAGAAAASAATPIPSDVVAVVNGEPISAGEYDAMLARRRAEMSVADETALETFVTTALINQKLIEQAAERMDVTVTDAELDAEIAQLKGIVEGNEAAWQAWLQQNNYTEPILREELRISLLTAKVRDEVVGNAPEQVTRQVHARHILVSTQAEAADIRRRLLNGESFVELAAEFSQDVTTRNEGGDLGWFTREELLEPNVAEAAFNQEVGDISEPVVTRLGFHVIETLGFDDLPLQPEKQAQVAQGIFDEWLITQYDSAIIEFNQS